MSFHSRTARSSLESSKQEMLSPSPLTSTSSQKPSKPAQKRSRQEVEPCGQDRPRSASSAKGSHKDPSVPKHRKVEGRSSGSSSEHKVSQGSPWGSVTSTSYFSKENGSWARETVVRIKHLS